MASEKGYDALAADLAMLGRSLTAPSSATSLTATDLTITSPSAVSLTAERLTAAVMARLSEAPTPVPASRWQQLLRRVAIALADRRRRALVVAMVILLALLGVPPVRAAVADWFGFAGVSVRLDPTPGPTVASSPPTVGGTTALAEARALVAFEPVLPAALGPPQGVEVSADRRILSMSWTDKEVGAVRLDQFDGRLDYAFAGHTLIWEHGQTALRLEGDLTLARAVEIAGSVTTVP